MPLSDNEQRILREIEKDFYDTDPKFAREVSETTLYKHALRNIRWAVLAGVVGLVGVIVGLQVHVLVAFLAFLLMFLSAIAIERNLRAMGRLGIAKVSMTLRSRRPAPGSETLSERMRKRFKRDQL